MPSLITLDDAKVYLQVRPNFTGSDDRIQNMINLASLQIEKFCNRTFTKDAKEELLSTVNAGPYDPGELGEFSGGVQRSLKKTFYVLGSYPLDETVAVRVWYDPFGQFGDETELVGGRDFFVANTSRNVRLTLYYPTKRYPYALKVGYTAGYEIAGTGLTGLPDEIKQACALQVMHLMNKVSQDSISVDQDRSQSGETGSKFSVQSGLIPEAAQLLAKYARSQG